MKDLETEKKIKEVLDKYEICYVYNETFKKYRCEEMTREQCQKFVDAHNQCKGGHWVIRPKGEWQEHYELIPHWLKERPYYQCGCYHY